MWWGGAGPGGVRLRQHALLSRQISYCVCTMLLDPTLSLIVHSSSMIDIDTSPPSQIPAFILYNLHHPLISRDIIPIMGGCHVPLCPGTRKSALGQVKVGQIGTKWDRVGYIGALGQMDILRLITTDRY